MNRKRDIAVVLRIRHIQKVYVIGYYCKPERLDDTRNLWKLGSHRGPLDIKPRIGIDGLLRPGNRTLGRTTPKVFNSRAKSE